MGQAGLGVLIVEDEPLIALEYETLLEGLGHVPLGVAVDHATALALATSHRPDVALVDLNLRDGPTGLAVAQDIARAHGARIVFITSERHLADVDEPHVIGCLPKPFTSALFRSVMDYVNQIVRSGGDAPASAAPAGLLVTYQYRD